MSQESPCEAARRLAAQKRDPSDVIVRRSRIVERCQRGDDAERCLSEYERAWYVLENDYRAMSRANHTRLKRRWWTIEERAQAAGIQIAGPGALLERWIHAVVTIGTLGLVSLQCSGCASRKAKLDRLGWKGIARKLITRLPRRTPSDS